MRKSLTVGASVARNSSIFESTSELLAGVLADGCDAGVPAWAELGGVEGWLWDRVSGTATEWPS